MADGGEETSDGRAVQIRDVSTWYDVRGSGEPLVLLHPGGADARAWEPSIDALAARSRVFTPERRGHGRTPDVAGPLSYELFTADAPAFVERAVGEPDLCNQILVDFLTRDSVPTLAPIRRAGS